MSPNLCLPFISCNSANTDYQFWLKRLGHPNSNILHDMLKGFLGITFYSQQLFCNSHCQILLLSPGTVPALWLWFGFRHFFLRSKANSAFILGSVSCSELKFRRDASKEEQCEKPKVWPLDKVAKSLTVKPLLAKLRISWLALKFGAGKMIVSDAFDTLPSFLPFSTFQ